MLVSFNWLKEYLGDTDLTPEKAADLLGAHAFEIEGTEAVGDDVVIDVDILPNRSSDCLSHRGIARELASITGRPLAHDPLRLTPELPTTDKIAVEIENPEACPRFAASVVTGVAVKDSPTWLKDRLEAIGQRPINNIVDATNYVMFAIGQPIHAYDAELFPQIDGQWRFTVRLAKPGETVNLIPEGGKEEDRVVECQGTELLIVDGSTDTPIGLAGVKGGSFAGVHKDTNRIIIETAHFNPTITRKTARRLGIVIDASKRFENEPSRDLIPYAQVEVTELITKIAGGELLGWSDTYLESSQPTTVAVTLNKVNQLLGLQLQENEVEEILLQIGAEVESIDGGFTVTAPWERTDLCIEEDYVEEIGRLHGYNHVAVILPEAKPVPELNARHVYSEQIRQVLIEHGFSEVITSSFRKKDTVQLKNALASDKSCLRSALRKNLSEVLDKNAGFTDLLGTTDTRVFEIGTVFYPGTKGVSEHVSLAFGVRLKASGYTGKEDKILHEALAALETKLGTPLAADVEGGIAEVNLTALLESLPAPTEYEAVKVDEAVAYQPFSVYQHISRDIALWVDEETRPESVEQVLDAAAGSLRVRTTLFDEFSKDGRTSLAFRLVFQSPNRTLTDSEINAVMDTVYKAVTEKGWEVR